MHVSLSAKKAALLSLLIWLHSMPVYSDDTGEVSVKSAETSLLGDDYVLNADIDYQLSNKATEALKNGVPLLWTYQFKVEELRDYLWNKTIIEKNILYRVQYHALLNVYRVKNESNGSVNNFSTLQAALDLLSTLRDYRLLEKSKILVSKTYLAKIKISFERDALPLPLRPIAYLNSQWYLSSDWFVWPLKK
ncbi:MAG: DUF4390 domain-containing protein [Methylococcaceae bacterium]|nr:DUF4390 domain-containing protein [Methylococcaceae bacterium]